MRLRRLLLPGPGKGALTRGRPCAPFPRYDLFFIVFYALLIPLVGVAAWSITGRLEAVLLALLLLALYLLLALRRPRRRLRAARARFPASGGNSCWPVPPISAAWTKRGERASSAMSACSWPRRASPAVGGAPVSWQTKLLIAAGAAAMLHGRPEWEPPIADGVTVYPGYAFDRNYRPGKGNIAGQAPEGGPLLIAEKSLLEGFAVERDGYNVLIHELAHYFDLEARKGGMKIGAVRGERGPLAGDHRRGIRAPRLRRLAARRLCLPERGRVLRRGQRDVLRESLAAAAGPSRALCRAGVVL